MNSPALHIHSAPLLANIELEQYFLGAVLTDPLAIEKVGSLVKPEYFSEGVHRRIWEICLELFDHDRTVTGVTVSAFIADEEAADWEEIGGRGYVARLCGAAIGSIGVEEQARDLIAWWQRRELQAVAGEAASMAANQSIPFDQITDMVEETTGELRQVGTRRRSLLSIDEAMEGAFQRAEAAHSDGTGIIGIATGLKDLDRMLGGLGAGDMIVIAGRPSMGKSTLALNITRNVVKQGIGVYYASPEMTAQEFGYRIMSDEAYERCRVAYSDFRQGKYGVDEYRAMQAARASLKGVPLRIEERAGASIPFLRAGVKRAAREFERAGTPLGMIVVDHIGLLTGPKSSGRYEMLTYISAEQKRLAKDFGVPVLALSQLSRQVEQRDDKRPQLSDLRESGAIEQDADVVIFPYRHDYYLERDKPSTFKTAEAEADYEAELHSHRNKADLIIAKQRNGPIGTVKAYCNVASSSFRDLGGGA